MDGFKKSANSYRICAFDGVLYLWIEMDRVEVLKDPLVLFAIISAFLMLADFVIRLQGLNRENYGISKCLVVF